jgi:hypothetical protein
LDWWLTQEKKNPQSKARFEVLEMFGEGIKNHLLDKDGLNEDLKT